MSADQLRWRDRVVVAQHELSVSAIVLAGVLDGRDVSENDWRRLVLALHRLRALLGAV